MMRDRDLIQAAKMLRPHLAGLVLLLSLVVSTSVWVGVDVAAGGEPFFNWTDYAWQTVWFVALLSLILSAFCAGPFVAHVRRHTSWTTRSGWSLRLACGSILGMVLVIGWGALRAIACAAWPGFSFTQATTPVFTGTIGRAVLLLSDSAVAPISWLVGTLLMARFVDPVVVRRWLLVSSPGLCDRCGYAVEDGATCPECGTVKTVVTVRL